MARAVLPTFLFLVLGTVSLASGIAHRVHPTPPAQLLPLVGADGELRVEAPKWRFAPAPNIPREIGRGTSTGVARARIHVAATGRVTRVEFLEIEPKGGLERAASVFFHRMIFWPEERDGKPVPFVTDLTLELGPAAPRS